MRQLIFAGLVGLALLGCATVGNGPMQRVQVESTSEGTTVRLQNCGLLSTKTAVTPAVVWVSRRSTQCRLFFSVPGQEDQSFRLIRHTSRTMDHYDDGMDVIGDLCGPDVKNCNSKSDLENMGFLAALLLVPSLAVDFVTGSMFELSPSRVVHDKH